MRSSVPRLQMAQMLGGEARGNEAVARQTAFTQPEPKPEDQLTLAELSALSDCLSRYPK